MPENTESFPARQPGLLRAMPASDALKDPFWSVPINTILYRISNETRVPASGLMFITALLDFISAKLYTAHSLPLHLPLRKERKLLLSGKSFNFSLNLKIIKQLQCCIISSHACKVEIPKNFSHGFN